MKINTADLRLAVSKMQMLSKVQQSENDKSFTNLYNEVLENKKNIEKEQKTINKSKKPYRAKLDNNSNKKNRNSNNEREKREDKDNKKNDIKRDYLGSRFDVRI
ncbi:hypothetical protein SAMN02745135_00240 [Caloranaerobacter azorensis DSM 13643]|uniref:Uncharacterized protein n=1 Tax=Caloranaerobacter azorensis DSM 13643 TaxID=1121264 RepID=A0A1M5RKI6_9FIRM|nr:hypothetical protein [Caloranaerobacter azorensis]SHH26731.1 hypothetical protein SAMN02745135_00240 [Caloranaerobacter azorensis DSM 13643]